MTPVNTRAFGRRVPDIVLVMDRTKDPDKTSEEKVRCELRIQCEIEIKDVDEARELFEALYGKSRSRDGVTKAHEIIKPKLDKNYHSDRFRGIVHQAFLDNGSTAEVPPDDAGGLSPGSRK